MKLPENRSDVVASASDGNQTCRGVLDCLQPSHQTVSDCDQGGSYSSPDVMTQMPETCQGLKRCDQAM